MSFYIEKIIVTGSGKTDSIIELSNGVNIIYGPSNTGKTYIVKCIDYMFGSEREPIDISTGYQYIKIIVRTQCGTITMSRKIGENKIEVSSNDNNVPSGKYATKASRTNYDKTINSVWLSLIGINDLHLVISNENYKKQILSWRTFSHMFMLTETKIISEYSAILSGRDTSNTAVIASLIFLLSGQDFAETETKDTKEIKEAKKNAVKAYINKELFRLSERNQELLAQLKENPNIDIAVEIEKIMAEISTNEKRINSSIEENQKILAQLYEKNENLSECNVLLNRYDELTTQYDADLKRLNFIVDGEANLNTSFSTHCPFCDGEVVVKKNQNYIDAAKSDYKKIKLQAKDLESASKELRSEKLSLEQEIGTLMAKKKSIEELIEKELKPQVFNLKEKLSTYKDAIECQKEIDILKKLSEQKTADMIENDTDEESELKFKVKEHLDYSFINELSNGIKSFLENCNYDNLLSVIFDKADMDIVINGKKKSSNGKGYNAYFNSVVAIVLSRYMESKCGSELERPYPSPKGKEKAYKLSEIAFLMGGSRRGT
ncbi:AAA family ATPase [Lachnospiraceae bacterium EP-SM-12S-S03]|nr:AAA family ATPase [Lachnospiraceae bacterium EP-SM-12S-S03]